MDIGAIVQWLAQTLPDDAIIANGAGNYTNWVHRFYPYRRFATQLAPQSGAMGYGVPAAVAAQIVHPDRVVVSFSGDGCFLMCGQELATARQYDLPIVFIVVNNGTYGTIRMHQERFYPGRVIGTDLVNPDLRLWREPTGWMARSLKGPQSSRAPLKAPARRAGRPRSKTESNRTRSRRVLPCRDCAKPR